MHTTPGSSEPETARDTLHTLSNVLASARVWLVVATNTPPEQRERREAVLADALSKLHEAIGDAEECCHRLHELVPAERPRRRR
jgi:hypothetical protein